MRNKSLIETRILALGVALVLLGISPSMFMANQASGADKDKPVLYYLDVESGPPGIFVTLNGSGFSLHDKFHFGPLLATPLAADSQFATIEPVPSRVTVTLPRLLNGSYSVAVETTNGMSNELLYTVRSGKIHYVAITGHDNGKGSEEDPWRSVDHAVRHVGPGDFVYIREGIYPEFPSGQEFGISWGTESDPYRAPTNGGYAGRPITLQSFPGERVVLAVNYRKRGVIKIEGANFINIVGLTFAHFAGVAINIGGAFGSPGSNNVRVVNNEFYDIAWTSLATCAIWAGTNTENVKILGNSVHDIGTENAGAIASYSLHVQGQNMEIAYNKIWDEPGNYDNRRSVSGIYSHGRRTPVRNMRIHSNLIFGLQHGMTLSGNPKTTYVYNNIFRDMDLAAIQNKPYGMNSGPLFIYHNVFVNNGRRPRYWESAVTPHIQNPRNGGAVKNNIFYSDFTDKTITGSGDYDYNIYFSRKGRPVRVPGKNSIVRDPEFIDVANNNFKVKPTSPAIEAGVDVGLPFSGWTPDIGRFERLPAHHRIESQIRASSMLGQKSN